MDDFDKNMRKANLYMWLALVLGVLGAVLSIVAFSMRTIALIKGVPLP